MKDKLLIYQGDPCTTRLADPLIRTLDDAGEKGVELCRYYGNRRQCSLPRFGCVQVAGLKVARYVLLFYSEASERTLSMEVQEFGRRAPLPPENLEAYIDTSDHDYRRITDPELVTKHVREYAEAVLDFGPGERIFRNAEEPVPPMRDPGAGSAPGKKDESIEVA